MNRKVLYFTKPHHLTISWASAVDFTASQVVSPDQYEYYFSHNSTQYIFSMVP